jgi:endonuclease YncB( thermonuclease family)
MKEIKVRLAGIDGPESSQAFGTKSKEALAEKGFGNTVTLESQGMDNYGRTLGTLKIGNRHPKVVPADRRLVLPRCKLRTTADRNPH